MTLPTTTRGSELVTLAPDNAAIVACIELATEPESAEYLVTQFKTRMGILGKDFIESSKSMLKTLEDNWHNICLQRNATKNHWAGMTPDSDYNNYQAGRAEMASQELLAHNINTIHADFAISNSSQLLRAFTENQLPLNTDSQFSMDNVLSSYFAQNDFYAEISEEGTFLYENDGKGGIRKNEKGEKIKANPEDVRALLNDQGTSFPQFLENYGIQATSTTHPYPEEAPVAAKTKEEVSKAKETPRQEEAPSTPSQGPTAS